jgi:hypothetical protein
MAKTDWTIDGIDPEKDYWLIQITEITRINEGTLWSWRKSGRLQVYNNRQLTRGQWVIDAYRGAPSISDPTRDRQKYRKTHPDRARAEWLTRDAIKRGELKRQPCEICSWPKNTQAHHDDYSKPLEVRWLCQKHHRWMHSKKAQHSRTKSDSVQIGGRP